MYGVWRVALGPWKGVLLDLNEGAVLEVKEGAVWDLNEGEVLDLKEGAFEPRKLDEGGLEERLLVPDEREDEDDEDEDDERECEERLEETRVGTVVDAFGAPGRFPPCTSAVADAVLSNRLAPMAASILGNIGEPSSARLALVLVLFGPVKLGPFWTMR